MRNHSPWSLRQSVCILPMSNSPVFDFSICLVIRLFALSEKCVTVITDIMMSTETPLTTPTNQRHNTEIVYREIWLHQAHWLIDWRSWNFQPKPLITISTGWPKKLAPFLYALTLPILTDFLNYVTVRIRRKFAIILSLKISPHLKCVAKLPCEMSWSGEIIMLQSPKLHVWRWWIDKKMMMM